MHSFIVAPMASVNDSGKVRLGAYAPTLAPTADAAKVRLSVSATSAAT